MSSELSDAPREYRLIEQLELRIANADTDEKFEAILQKFLTALLLKLGSPAPANRNLAIKVCQYIHNRLKINPLISLPVSGLLKTFQSAQNAFVKRFALLFVEQGLQRIKGTDSIKLLPDLLRTATPASPDTDESSNKMWSIAFEFLLQSCPDWKIPPHATREDSLFGDEFSFTDTQSVVLSETLNKFLLFDPKLPTTHAGLSKDFIDVFTKNLSQRPRVVPVIAKFLFSSVFVDEQRLVSAILLTTEASESANSIGDSMFKQCQFDLESDRSVESLFHLYDIGKPRLQLRVLALLARSSKSTAEADRILRMVETQLFQNSGGLEASKLRTAVFQYLNWAVRMSDGLYSVTERLQTVLKEFVELQGWPTFLSPSTSDADLRSKAYESLGLLATIKTPNDTADTAISINLVTWLFTSLRCDATVGANASINESLSHIIGSFTIENEQDKHDLTQLLLWNVGAAEGDEDPTYFLPTKFSTRYLATRFANKCLPFADVTARYINIVALGYSNQPELLEEARRGLNPYWYMSNSSFPHDHGHALHVEIPHLTDFVQRVFKTSSSSSSPGPSAPSLEPESLAAAVLFARNILMVEAHPSLMKKLWDDDNWTHRLGAMLSNDRDIRDRVRDYINSTAGEAVFPILVAACRSFVQGNRDAVEVAVDLASLCPNPILSKLNTDELMSPLLHSLKSSIVQPFSSRLYGIIGSLSESNSSVVSEMLQTCSAWATSVGMDAVKVKGHLLASAAVLTRSSLRETLQSPCSQVPKLSDLVSNIIVSSRDKSLKTAAYMALGQLSLCIQPTVSHNLTATDLTDAILIDARAENEPAVAALGRFMCSQYATAGMETVQPILEKVFALHEIRKAEFHFAVGEALAAAALGFRSTSTITELDVDVPRPTWGYHPALLKWLLERCITECKTTKPSLKKASAIWLLCLLQYCDEEDILKPCLQQGQAAFARLLSDRDEVTQEIGSRGLSIVFEKGDKNLQEDLVRELVQSFTSTNAKMSGTVNEDTQLFEAGTLPTEGGQSVTTYKDIVSLATEMGDPSLVYRFMNLASNNAIWSSRAAFGRFGLSGVLADSSFLSQNKKFYPKLFRYRFDPNPNVQRSMDDIWKALVKDPNRVIEDNFDLIMEDLLKSIVAGKEWRAREASCGAIADLVQGRDVERFEKYLNELWTVAFKVLDDVKETVRVAALKLCRTLTNMLIRNLEVGDGGSKRASIMLSHATPFLLQQMEGGLGQEVQQYATSTLLEIVKKSPSKPLRTFAPAILETLVLSLSSLEHESINYLHLNADKYGLTAEKLDQMRVSSINASPVSDAIERCLDSLQAHAYTDVQATGEDAGTTQSTATTPVDDAMSRLAKAFRSAIGLPSKVGLSRVMVTLTVRHATLFRPYVDRFVQLTRKSILDRNSTISVSFSMALGYLLRLSSDAEVRATTQYARQLYFRSEDLSHRAVAGEMIQAIAKAASDVFTKFAVEFLPLTWIGSCDMDADVQTRFKDTWKENVGGSRALNLYLGEIVELVSTHIKSSLWPIRQACSMAVAELINSMAAGDQYTEPEAQLLWPVVEDALNGKTWSGKEQVITAFPKFVKRARSIWVGHGKQMRAIIMREAKRVNPVYRPYGLAALGEFAATWADLDLDADVMAVLTNVVADLSDPDDAMDVDGAEEPVSRIRTAEATWDAVVKSLFLSVRGQSRSQTLAAATEIVLHARREKSWKVDNEIRTGMSQFIIRTTEDVQRVTRPVPDDSQVDDQSGANVRKFLEQLVLATLDADRDSHASDNETTRKSRVDLVVVLAEHWSILSPSTIATLVGLTECWSPTERSRPLKTALDRSRDLLGQAGAHSTVNM